MSAPKIIPGTMLAAMIEKSFKEADKDNSGYIDGDELETVLGKFYKEVGVPAPTKADIEDACKKLDYDKDGKIQMNEYSILVKNMIKKQVQIS